MNEVLSQKRLKDLDELLGKLDVSCGRMALFNEALVHSSYSAEHPDVQNNERLEFFGDSVLKFVVSEYLLERFPEYSEGKLSEIRSVLVSGKTLEEVAATFKLGKYILVGRRVSMRPSITARSMEAILGALYLDSGLFPVQNLIIRLFGTKATAVDREDANENFKAKLQEHTQANQQGLPVYQVLNTSGPAHSPNFEVSVTVGDKVLGTGKGSSKKAAEQAAAQNALQALAG
jgi:ribonuclease-3